VSRLTLECIQPPVQWVPGTLVLGVQQPGHEADCPLLPSAEVKNVWGYTSNTPNIFMLWCLIKDRGKFAFTLLILQS